MSQLDKLYSQWLDVQPLSSDDEKRLKRKFMLDFNYNSNHIEGNTLTYGQTEVLLLLGEVIGSAKMKDLEEMKAHNICLNMVEQEAQIDEPLTETFIRQVHQVITHFLIRPNASLSTLSTTLGISSSAIQKQVDNLAQKAVSPVQKVKNVTE